jgi:hypothetical protein
MLVAGGSFLAIPPAVTGMLLLTSHTWWRLFIALLGTLASVIALWIFGFALALTGVEPGYEYIALGVIQVAFYVSIASAMPAFVVAIVERTARRRSKAVLNRAVIKFGNA